MGETEAYLPDSLSLTPDNSKDKEILLHYTIGVVEIYDVVHIKSDPNDHLLSGFHGTLH